MDNLSSKVTNHSINFIRDQIRKKTNYEFPYYTNTNAVENIVSDRNEFPYPRYYRGRADINVPIVYEREAGYRMAKPFKFHFKSNFDAKPRMCFQYPCTVDFPCRAPVSHPNAYCNKKKCKGKGCSDQQGAVIPSGDAEQPYSTDYTTYSSEDDTPIPIPCQYINISP
tara:strand:+ start:50 stop:553 length:504 start_codon:yes stop_codon:yes gene_type:complete